MLYILMSVHLVPELQCAMGQIVKLFPVHQHLSTHQYLPNFSADCILIDVQFLESHVLFSVAWEVLPRISILHFLKLLYERPICGLFQKNSGDFFGALDSHQKQADRSAVFLWDSSFVKKFFFFVLHISRNRCEIHGF